MSKIWRCFHCGDVFRSPDAARLHFGPSQFSEPACQVSAERLRELEDTLRRYREEDTDLHRAIYRLQCQHRTELLREEEKGYAKGLKDGMTDAWKAGELYRAIEHGDAEHREWLKDALECFFSGRPVPAPRGGNLVKVSA